MIKYKRTATFIISGILALFLIWLLHGALQPLKLQLGDGIPRIAIQTAAGADTLQPVPGLPMLIMCFSRKCPHCIYELGQFEQQMERFSGMQVLLMTTEREFSPGIDNLRWPNLSHAVNITWARVDEGDYKRCFGTAISPAYFIFDSQGRLTAKLRGEIKLDRLFESF
mgnify:CR=1 FL=1